MYRRFFPITQKPRAPGPVLQTACRPGSHQVGDTLPRCSFVTHNGTLFHRIA
jgi:hypothetical protein